MFILIINYFASNYLELSPRTGLFTSSKRKLGTADPASWARNKLPQITSYIGSSAFIFQLWGLTGLCSSQSSQGFLQGMEQICTEISENNVEVITNLTKLKIHMLLAGCILANCWAGIYLSNSISKCGWESSHKCLTIKKQLRFSTSRETLLLEKFWFLICQRKIYTLVKISAEKFTVKYIPEHLLLRESLGLCMPQPVRAMCEPDSQI